ncbi:MAG: polysaccharide deacetylase family protein [Phycisphaerales bacterium]|nr:MAG: polysaccharide deacetylase family protein [Phycisphaerales bacterium]
MFGHALRDIKGLIEWIGAVLYAPWLLLMHKGPLRSVIYYHGVARKDVPDFKKQMAYLAECCSVVEPSKIMTACSNGARCIVAITFDDAFLSVFENAVPVLKEHGLPAGIFVPAGCLGGSPSWVMPETSGDKDEVLMSERHIAGLDKDGFEIFSHTLSHPVLTKIEDGRLKKELADSKQMLEEIVGHEVHAISYPHGAHNDRVRVQTQKAGYKLGFTIEPKMVTGATDRLTIGRFKVSAGEGLLTFGLKVRGAYQVSSYLRRIKALVSLRPSGRSCRTQTA